MLLSSLLLFMNVRDRTALLLAATISAFSMWIGLRTGLAGWPSPWLPSAEAMQVALLLLPPFGLAALWSTAVVFSRTESVFPQVRYTHVPVFALAMLASAGWTFWPEGRELIYPTLRGITALLLFLLLLLMAAVLRSGQRGALAVLVAVAPPLLVIGPLYDTVLRAWRGSPSCSPVRGSRSP